MQLCTKVNASIWIYRIRSSINAKLMKMNANMMLECGIFEIDHTSDHFETDLEFYCQEY